MLLPILAKAGGDIAGNALSGYGQVKATRAAGKQIKAGMQENEQLSDEMMTQQQGLQSPYMQLGQRAMADYENFRMREAGPYQSSQFSGVDMSQDPGAQFRMDQSQRALDQSASGRGTLFSGAQQKALQANAQNLASQEFGNAYNRQYGQFRDAEDANRQQYNTDADRTMNYDQYRMGQLQDQTNMGQSATNTLGSALGGIVSNQLQNQMMLRGNLADVNAARAAAPWNVASRSVSSGANSLGNYFMSK